MDQVLAEFRDRIGAAAADRAPLCIRGGGSKDWYGQAPQGAALETRAYAGIIDYEPTELVITARCGTPLAEIEAALAAQNQMLAFEPPHFGTQATIGGAVAAGLSGPARQAVGALRDFVLGTVLMDGKGEVLHFGGQVMKNVAGYDVSRLLAGSLGTLGLLLEVSLKVLPRPFATCSVRLAVPQAEALQRLNQWGGQPLPISASLWQDDVLTVRLAGAEAAVAAARARIGGEVVDDAPAFWQAAREQTLPFFDGVGGDDGGAGNGSNGSNASPRTAPLWRLSLPSVAPVADLAGAQLIEWGGAQRWLRSTAPAAVIRAKAEALGGHATLFCGGDKSVGVFQPLAPAIDQIHRRLKSSFDPNGIFNPGRMYAGM